MDDNKDDKEKIRFIPYKGKKYDSTKIFIVGPGHYCDGIFDTRNLMPSFVQDIKDSKECLKKIELQELILLKLIEKKDDGSFIFKVGCYKYSPIDCLKLSIDEKFVCPVIKDLECPRYNENCEDKNKVGCNGKRQLRCETLLAIYDYTCAKDKENNEKKIRVPLDECYKISSANHGHYFFNSISEYLKKQFKMTSSIWDEVAFMNIIQRYIYFRGTNDEYINDNIRPSDIKNFIDLINPEPSKTSASKSFETPAYVIVTMNCIAKALSADEWFKEHYVKDLNRCKNNFICFKYVKKHNGVCKLNNLENRLVINCLLEVYNIVEKKSPKRAILIFLYYGYQCIEEEYPSYQFDRDEIKNILLDHVIYWKQQCKEVGGISCKENELLDNLQVASFKSYAYEYGKNSCLEFKSKKGDGNTRSSRRNAYRDKYIEQEGEKFKKDHPDFQPVFFKKEQ